MIELVLPGKPRGKGTPWPIVRNGKAIPIKQPAAREYERNLYAVATQYMLKRGLKPLEGALVVRIHAWMVIPKSWPKKKQAAARACEIYPTVKPDANNISKSLDGLNGVCWVDDAQIVYETTIKRYSDFPRLVVRIREVEPQEFDEDLPF
ncbi:MAG: RusA family crossover junction endodeoxyribonuclease [Dehalococcoidales bacterium]